MNVMNDIMIDIVNNINDKMVIPITWVKLVQNSFVKNGTPLFDSIKPDYVGIFKGVLRKISDFDAK